MLRAGYGEAWCPVVDGWITSFPKTDRVAVRLIQGASEGLAACAASLMAETFAIGRDNPLNEWLDGLREAPRCDPRTIALLTQYRDGVPNST